MQEPYSCTRARLGTLTSKTQANSSTPNVAPNFVATMFVFTAAPISETSIAASDVGTTSGLAIGAPTVYLNQ